MQKFRVSYATFLPKFSIAKSTVPTAVVVDLQETFLDVDGRFRRKLVDGVWKDFVSVTTVLGLVRVKGFLDKWEQDMIDMCGIDGFKKYMERKADEGTALHNLIELYLSQQKEKSPQVIDRQDYLKVNNFVWGKFLTWTEWWNQLEEKPEIVWMEQEMFSMKHGISGKPDCLVRFKNGEYWLLDWKSGKCGDKYKLQLAMYIKMIEETLGIKCSGGIIISVGEETKQGWKETEISATKKHKNSAVGETETEYYLRGFLTYKKLVDFEIPRFGPNHLELPRYILPQF